jgi:hypothetical protein
MNYLHYEVDAGPDEVIEVTLDKQANVLLLDDPNYRDYQAGRSYRYHGGLATVSPVRLRPPHSGPWHVVVDLGGYPGSVRASVETISSEAALPHNRI